MSARTPAPGSDGSPGTPPRGGHGLRGGEAAEAGESASNSVSASVSASAPLVEVTNLSIAFGRGPDVVRGLDLAVGAGEIHALVGESGSGKSVTARALLGLAGAGARVRADALSVDGHDLRGRGERELRPLRGSTVAMIPQDALAGLDPLRPVGREIETTLQLHTSLGAAARRRRVLELLARVGMDDPELRAGQRPGELSGGLRQRALIAQALAGDPRLLIADEPTTALDARLRGGILRLLRSLAAEGGAGILLISHDLGAVAGIADAVTVMRAGEALEAGPASRVLGAPAHPYTRLLLAADPRGVPRHTPLLAIEPVAAPHAEPVAESIAEPHAESISAPHAESVADPHARARVDDASVLLEGEGLGYSYGRGAARRTVLADASVRVRAGRTLGLIGESGSGKTTLARLLLGLAEPETGSVALRGEPWSPLPERERRSRRPRIALVAQDALSGFDPRLTAGQILAEALSAGRSIRVSPRRARIADSLAAVGLAPEIAAFRPLHLSGGQRQRLSIARALAAEPEVLVCDEPVSALDLSVQAQVLDLLDSLQRERGLGILLISHDLDVIAHMSDEVAVMRAGRILERGPADRVFAAPSDPYTRELLARSGATGAIGEPEEA